MRPKPNKLTDLLKRWEAAKEAGRQFYAQADELQDEIEKELKLDAAPHNMGDGREAVLSDPWLNQKKPNTKIWKHVGVRRYELEIRKAPTTLTK